MEFRTQFSDRVPYFSEPGSGEKDLFIAEYSKDGVLCLAKNGVKDLYSEIQSHKESCLIKNILQRYEDGDYTALNRAQGAYVDVTNMPTTIAEMFNLTLKGEAEFNSLPVDTRAKFGHSFESWLSTAGTDAWALAMGFIKEPSTTVSDNSSGGADNA